LRYPTASKKKIEARVLAAARKAGAPIPTGEIPGEEPDFRFHAETGVLGIELTELLRPASSNEGIVPVEEESFHQQIVRIAQEEYDRAMDGKPARVVAYFANARGKKRNKCDMARSLAEFVKANIHRANPVIALSGVEVPEGFGSMSITSEPGDWWCGECGGVTVSQIREQLASRIAAKNELVPTYRANLPKGARVWLLLYSTVAVSRSMPIPHGIEEWKLPFGFDRVFWFTALGNQFVEIQRAESDERVAV
jgi:hypothetical protein